MLRQGGAQIVRISNVPSLDRFQAKPKWEMSALRKSPITLKTGVK